MPNTAYPGRKTPRSYCGPYTLAQCPSCRQRVYLPPDCLDGHTTHCSHCQSLVQWEAF